MDSLSKNKEIFVHFENIGKRYITRSGQVSKPPQRLSYIIYIDITNSSLLKQGTFSQNYERLKK